MFYYAIGDFFHQVALISTMVGPDIIAAAAEAAVAALCDETACPREIFDGEEDFPSNGFSSPSSHSKSERLFIYLIFIPCCS